MGNLWKILKSQLILDIPKSEIKKYEEENFNLNRYRILFSLLIMFGVQILMLVAYFLASGESKTVSHTYLYISLLEVSLTSFLFVFLFKNYLKLKNKILKNILYVYFVAYITLEIIILSVENGQSASLMGLVYIFILLSIIPVFSIGITFALLSYFVFGVTFLAVAKQTYVIGENIYSTAVLVITLVVTFLLYVFLHNSQLKFFMINKKNMENMNKFEYDNKMLLMSKKQLDAISHVDVLTGIPNWAGFDSYIIDVWDKCLANSKPITIMVMDIDNLQKFNHKYGDLVGDEVIKQIANQINIFFKRSADFFARYSGEEFIAVLPFTSSTSIERLAEEIRNGVENISLENIKIEKEDLPTISIGVSTRKPDENSDYNYMIDIANRALISAKFKGGNCICYDFDENKSNIFFSKSTKSKEDAWDTDFNKINKIFNSTILSVFTINLRTGEIFLSKEILKYIDSETSYFSKLEDFVKFIYKDDQEMLLTLYEDVKKTGECDNDFKFLRIIDKDDSILWIALRTVVRKSENGALDLLGSFSLSSQIYQLEIQKSVSETINKYTYHYDYRSKKIYFSNEFYKLFDILEDEKYDIEKIVAHVAPYKSGVLAQFLANNQRKNSPSITEFEFDAKLPNGKYIAMKCNGKNFLDSKGITYLSGGIITDITELKEMNTISQLLIDGPMDDIFIFNIVENTFEISERALNYIGLKTNKFDNAIETLLKIVIPEDRELFIESIKPIMNGISSIYVSDYRVVGVNHKLTWVSCRGQVSFSGDGKPHLLVGTLCDINSLEKYTNYVKDLTSTDSLTGLPNRLQFFNDFPKILLNKEESGYIILLDIDNFKNINENLDFKAGDQFLKYLGRYFKNTLQANEKVYHFGSDLFLFHLPGFREEQVTAIMQKLKDFSISGVLIEEIYFSFSFSMGAVNYDSETKSVDAILNDADIAVQNIKNKGKNDYGIFGSEDRQKHHEQSKFELKIKTAVLDNCKGFEMYFQPLFDGSGEKNIGAEALIRWKDENDVLYPPIKFIPYLEKSGLIVEVEKWALKSICENLKNWLTIGLSPKFTMNVNASVHSLNSQNFKENFLDTLKSFDIPTSNIVLEITESCLIMDMQSGTKILKEIRDQGIRIAIDDFGTGYSSLSYIRSLPIDEIKIDKSFIDNIETNDEDLAFVESIIGLAQSLGFLICIEGIEKAKQHGLLKNMNLEFFQGYFFDVPLSKSQFEKKYVLKKDK